HRRGRAADPLLGAAQPRLHPGPGHGGVRRTGDQAAGPSLGRGPWYSLCRARLRRTARYRARHVAPVLTRQRSCRRPRPFRQAPCEWCPPLVGRGEDCARRPWSAAKRLEGHRAISGKVQGGRRYRSPCPQGKIVLWWILWTKTTPWNRSEYGLLTPNVMLLPTGCGKRWPRAAWTRTSTASGWTPCTEPRPSASWPPSRRTF